MSDVKLRNEKSGKVGRWEHGMIGRCGNDDGKYSRWEDRKTGGWKYW